MLGFDEKVHVMNIFQKICQMIYLYAYAHKYVPKVTIHRLYSIIKQQQKLWKQHKPNDNNNIYLGNKRKLKGILGTF